MLLTRFWKNRKGSVAPLMGIAIIPLMGAVGAAVDYSRANATKAAFQTSLNSAALMLSKTAAGQPTSALEAQAVSYVNALFTANNAQNVTVTATYSNSNGSQLVLNGSAVINTNFLSVLGIDQLNITASSTSTWGNTRLRVALVLDNTGSMASSNKMTALKTASQNLLTQLKTAAVTADDVYVSIIPFNKDVNVDASNVNATWLRWDLWDAVNGKCSNTTYKTQSSCVAAGKTWTPNNHSTWNGCVTDRDQNFDTTNDAPVAGSTLYPTEQYSSCPVVAGRPEQRLDRAVQQDHRHAAGRQYQPGDRPADGLAVADGGAVHGAGHGPELPVQAGHHPAQRRPEHPGPLVHQCLVDRHAAAENLRQHQGRGDHDLYRAGQYRTTKRPRPCCRIAPATPRERTDHFFLLTSSEQIVTTFGQIGTALSNLRLAM